METRRWMCSFCRIFPPSGGRAQGSEWSLPGVFQALYYGPDGALRSAFARWSGEREQNMDENAMLSAIPQTPAAQAQMGGGQLTFKAELPVELTYSAQQALPMVTGAELGQPIPADPSRPSLILRRAGESRLWDIAKSNGTTVDAIRKANSLQEDPAPGQMLLIPVS